MAFPTNTFATYAAVGNREDLENVIYNISPTDTPFMSMAGRGTAAATFHEWQTDVLAAASTSNAHVQGDDDTAAAIAATTRVGNRTQIFKKTASVTGTQDVVDKAGRSSEMAYQMEKRIKELKRDMEATLTGNQAPVTGDSTTAPKLRSLESWYVSNISRGASGANGSASTAATDGTQRALTEDMVKDVLQSTWSNGGNPDTIMVGPYNKRVISGFAGNANRVIGAEDKKLVTAIDIYDSDFGDLKIVPNRFSRDRTLHILDSNMVAVDYLRSFKTYDLAKTGDSTRKSVLCEATLKVNNEAAHGVVADLTTAA